MILVPTLTSAIALIVAIAKAPFEIGKSSLENKEKNTDYSINLQRIASTATEENRVLRTDLAQLRKDFEDYQEKTEADVGKVNELEHNIEEMGKQLTVALNDAQLYRGILIDIVKELKAITNRLEEAILSTTQITENSKVIGKK